MSAATKSSKKNQFNLPDEWVPKYRALQDFANRNPMVISLLYDLGLLPEQVSAEGHDFQSQKFRDMTKVMAHFKVFAEETRKMNEAKVETGVRQPPMRYAMSDLQPDEAIDRWGLPFRAGNIVKYVVRAEHQLKLANHTFSMSNDDSYREAMKGIISDYKKAIDYAARNVAKYEEVLRNLPRQVRSASEITEGRSSGNEGRQGDHVRAEESQREVDPPQSQEAKEGWC